jgi:hypothetical protein
MEMFQGDDGNDKGRDIETRRRREKVQWIAGLPARRNGAIDGPILDTQPGGIIEGIKSDNQG